MRFAVVLFVALFLFAVRSVPASGIPWDLANPPFPTGAVYFSNVDGGTLGMPVYTGDFNNDGAPDTVAGTMYTSLSGFTHNGSVQVVLGDNTTTRTVNMATYSGARVTVIGSQNNAFFGVEMNVADFDGDGFDDLVVGASHGRYYSTAPAAGEVGIIFGAADFGVPPTTFSIATPPAGQRVKYFLGERATVGSTIGDRLGAWFSSGDLDENGRLDLVMGMDQSNGLNNNRANSGAVVIAWDAAYTYPERPYIRAGDAATSDALTIIYGVDPNDLFGATNMIGDFDGDHHLDLVVSAGVTRSGLGNGALGYAGSGGGDGPTNTRSNAGETTIFWNARELRGFRKIDLSANPTLERTVIYGEAIGGNFGEELSSGDVNGDGKTDLLVGALTMDSVEANLAGAAYLFQDSAALRASATVDLLSPPANSVVALMGREDFGIGGDTLEVADINGDGKGEIFYGVPYGSPEGRNRAGRVVILYGGQNFPFMPSRVAVGEIVIPSLLNAQMYGAESNDSYGDFLSYSCAIGDMNSDGIPEYIANAMQGDGFQNAYPNAGEFYILDGDKISRLASAPANASAQAGDTVLSWSAAQAIFGPITGYQVRIRRDGAGADETVTVSTTNLSVSELPAPANVLGVRTVMQSAGGPTLSAELPITPPVHSAGPAAPNGWMNY
ncbi:integrin alpha [soil metagenome]